MKIRQQGFTLIELMVVVVLLGVLFGAVANVSTGINRRGRDSQRQTDLLNIQSALQQYYADEHVYPETMPTVLSGLAFVGPSGKMYLTKTPTDPAQTDPSGTRGTPYCYISQIAQGVDGCSNAVNSTTKCEYYQLCANLENISAGATACTCNTKAYNFSVHTP